MGSAQVAQVVVCHAPRAEDRPGSFFDGASKRLRLVGVRETE